MFLKESKTIKYPDNIDEISLNQDEKVAALILTNLINNAINTQGTDIGLNIAKHHLENLGGTISFKSEEHKGTTFTITIPNTAKQ